MARVTDHKPLLSILSEEKGIPQLDASRLQRWAIILSGYSYILKQEIETTNSNAGCFSRYPKGCENDRCSRITRNSFRRKKMNQPKNQLLTE